MTSIFRLSVAAALVAVSGSTVFAQGARPGGPRRQAQQPATAVDGQAPAKAPAGGDAISPAYIQQMFDTMAVMEADKFLALSAEQYPIFVQKLKRLQDVRGQSNRRRMKLLNDLRALVGPQAAAATSDQNDAAIDAKVKELQAFESDMQGQVRRALDDLDAGLTPRQRARYRLLEENLERRKLDFITRVRQPGRGGR